MLKNEVETSQMAEQLFKNNPELARLPEAAAERGMYGVFIVGCSSLFFVYGYDEYLLTHGDFVEIDGRLYEMSAYLKEHRAHIRDNKIVARSYNAVVIDDVQTQATYSAIIWQMNYLEKVMCVAHTLRRKEPEYFVMDDGFRVLLDAYKNDLFEARSERDRRIAWDKIAMQFDYNYLTQFNLRPTDRDYTLADYMISPYCVDTNPKKVAKIFKHPEKWEDHLFSYTRDYADNPCLTSMFINVDMLDDFEKQLKLHQVPYRVSNDKLIDIRTSDSIHTGYGMVQAHRENTVAVVFPSDYAVFAYSLYNWASIENLYKPELQSKAVKLFESGEFYMFDIPTNAVYDIALNFAGIPWYPHPHLSRCYSIGTEFVSCITELQYKPDIDRVLFAASMDNSFVHEQGTIHDFSALECRYPTIDKTGYVRTVCDREPDVPGYHGFYNYDFQVSSQSPQSTKADLISQRVLATPLRGSDYKA